MDQLQTRTSLGVAWTRVQMHRALAAIAGLAAIAVISVAAAFAATRPPTVGDPAARPFGDSSYAQVEALRGGYGLASAPRDGSYDAVEAIRAEAPQR